MPFMFSALPALVWVEIEATTVEVDGLLEVLGVAEAAGGLLDPLDDHVGTLDPGVGEVTAQVGQQVRPSMGWSTPGAPGTAPRRAWLRSSSIGA